jgi:hypothetical protein
MDRTARIWDAATGWEIATLVGHVGWVATAAFSQDGRRIVTASGDGSSRVWDVSHTVPIAAALSVALTAALAYGVGQVSEPESKDLLMQEAPHDLYREACRQLLDRDRYSGEEIARRERLLEQAIVALRAPLHPNCYLSPSQFVEQFSPPKDGRDVE